MEIEIYAPDENQLFLKTNKSDAKVSLLKSRDRFKVANAMYVNGFFNI